MLDVTTLKDNSTSLEQISKSESEKFEGFSYHLRTADLHDLSSASSKRSFTPYHVSTVAEHGDANERIAISVPVHNWFVVFPGTARDTFISLTRCFLSSGSKTLFLLLLSLHGDVDVGNLKVHLRNKIDTGNFGNNGQRLWILPRVIYEWCIAIMISGFIFIIDTL
jgi:hypothetical protein